jgi:hypothetical protein
MLNYQNLLYGMLAVYAAGFIISAFVVYLFYARLRDIGDELRKFRIAYEFAHPPESRAQSRRDHSSESARPEPSNPFAPSEADAKHKPKAE